MFDSGLGAHFAPLNYMPGVALPIMADGEQSSGGGQTTANLIVKRLLLGAAVVAGGVLVVNVLRRWMNNGEYRLIPGPSSNPEAIVAEEDKAPDYAAQRPSESYLYHSGQAQLFAPDVKKLAELSVHSISSINVHPLPHLKDYLSNLPTYDNAFFRTRTGEHGRRGYNVDISDDQVILADLVRKKDDSEGTAFIRAGPRNKIYFSPKECRAAIVTCGGLCPGLNDVVCEIVRMLYYNYSVGTIYGIRMGYRGFYEKQYLPYLELTPSTVQGLHKLGGTFLGSSRGGFDLEKIINAIIKHGITQVYVIGGDGTHRGATALFEEIQRRKLKIVICGIPKTIDNDISIIDRSFGFYTAVEEAEKAITSVKVEAQCCPYGVGLVQLMGRHAGFIATHATLASRDVDLCLIPEVNIELEGPDNIIPHIEHALEMNGHCVIVVAEGAGSNILKADPDDKDESGNPKLPEIGRYLKTVISKHFKAKGINVGIKYNDPSYMIRSVKANASDSILCMLLAQNSVHGAMAGFTGFTSGLVNNRTCYLPISIVTATSPTFLNPLGRTWERVIQTTHQPCTLSKLTAPVHSR